MRMSELDVVARRFDEIDLALLPINGLTIRPLLNRQVVMNAAEAAHLTRTLRPRLAVPIHYALTGGPIRDRLLLKNDPGPEMYVNPQPTSPRTPRFSPRANFSPSNQPTQDLDLTTEFRSVARVGRSDHADDSHLSTSPGSSTQHGRQGRLGE